MKETHVQLQILTFHKMPSELKIYMLYVSSHKQISNYTVDFNFMGESHSYNKTDAKVKIWTQAL